MKKLLFAILFLFFCSTVVAAPPPITTEGAYPNRDITFHGNVSLDSYGVPSEVVTETTQALTLYVRTTGDDSNDCLSLANACLTAQSALDRSPRHLRHDVVLDLGEGDMGPLHIGRFTTDTGGSLTIQGVLGQPTLASGNPTGTATGGSTTQLVDIGNSWTNDDLRGYLVLVDGEHRIVRNNTSDTINFIGPYSASVSGKSYEILEQKTEFTGTSLRGLGPFSFSSNYGSSFRIYDVKAGSGTVSFYIARADCEVRVERSKADGGLYGIFFGYNNDCRAYDVYATNTSVYGVFFTVTNSGESKRLYAYDAGVQGISLYNGVVYNLDYVYADNNSTGIYMATTVQMALNSVYADSNSSTGIFADYAYLLELDEVESTNNGSDGVFVAGANSMDIDSGNISDNGGYGIKIGQDSTGNRTGNQFVNMVGTLTIENNASGGIIVKARSGVAVTAVSGTNTGGYGIQVDSGSYALITSATAITGASGDATANGGTTSLTWATDFANNGDVVINLSNLSSIERKD
jgi:hypothetical protein